MLKSVKEFLNDNNVHDNMLTLRNYFARPGINEQVQAILDLRAKQEEDSKRENSFLNEGVHKAAEKQNEKNKTIQMRNAQDRKSNAKKRK